MAQFTPSAKTANDFNNGNEYVNHVDSPSAEDFNNVIESQLYTQGLATNQPDVSEANNIGTPSVEIVEASDGSAKMKFKNLKGDTGATGQQGEKGNTGAVTKWYDSVEDMTADYSNQSVDVGDTVAIKNALDLFVKGAATFESVGSLLLKVGNIIFWVDDNGRVNYKVDGDSDGETYDAED